MNAQQKERAIKVIEDDCQIEGQYIDHSDQTCAVGALAIAARIPKFQLRQSNYLSIGSETNSNIREIAAKIEKKFGLNQTQLHKIQHLNDDSARPATRRRRIIKYLKTL